MASYRLMSGLLPPSRFYADGPLPSVGGDGSCFHHVNPTLRFLCSSLQHNSINRQRSAASSTPTCDRRDRFLRSTLASSLLSHQMQTPQGQSLLAMMTHQSLPLSLISQAASQQLELLVLPTASPPLEAACAEAQDTDTLHRRIGEVKERERNKAVQEIIYALVASRLLYTMLACPQEHTSYPDHMLAVSKLSKGQQDTTVMMQQLQQCHDVDDRLQAIQPPEVQPLTTRHVAMVLYGKDCARVHRLEPNACAQVDRFEMGKMYAASVMHGYFLARVHQRFQLDRMLILSSLSMRPGKQVDSKKPLLEDYINGDGFQDAGTLRQMSSISSFYTLDVIEHHCAALFGDLSFHKQRAAVISNDVNKNVNMHLSLVTSLLYQALAFGFLLWDVEHNFTPLYPHICIEH